MKCGCRAQGTNATTGKPVCVVHAGLTPDAEIPAEVQPNLTGRMAVCIYCHREVASSLSLPFFRYQPDQPKDDYYNGCRGWD